MNFLEIKWKCIWAMLYFSWDKIILEFFVPITSQIALFFTNYNTWISSWALIFKEIVDTECLAFLYTGNSLYLNTHKPSEIMLKVPCCTRDKLMCSYPISFTGISEQSSVEPVQHSGCNLCEVHGRRMYICYRLTEFILSWRTFRYFKLQVIGNHYYYISYMKF